MASLSARKLAQLKANRRESLRLIRQLERHERQTRAVQDAQARRQGFRDRAEANRLKSTKAMRGYVTRVRQSGTTARLTDAEWRVITRRYKQFHGPGRSRIKSGSERERQWMILIGQWEESEDLAEFEEYKELKAA